MKLNEAKLYLLVALTIISLLLSISTDNLLYSPLFASIAIISGLMTFHHIAKSSHNRNDLTPS